MPLAHPKGSEEEMPPFAFLRRLWQERGSSEQTRHQLLSEVSLGNTQLIGALDLVVPLHECCLKIELKCDSTRYSLVVNKEVEHIAMKVLLIFLLWSVNC